MKAVRKVADNKKLESKLDYKPVQFECVFFQNADFVQLYAVSNIVMLSFAEFNKIKQENFYNFQFHVGDLEGHESKECTKIVL